MKNRESYLSVEHLTVRYGDQVAVKDISFEVYEGEMVSLIGPSGCGKTTILRCIAGLQTPERGIISLGGEVLTQRPGTVLLEPEKRSLAMVFQSYAVWPHMNVFENVAYGLKARRIEAGEIRRRVLAVLDLLGLGGLDRRAATHLSGGQQQRVALARAVVLEPKILLLDEPLSNLDAKLRESTRFELRELQQRLGITAVYVTHDQVEAMALSDRLIVMRKGRIDQEGLPHDVFTFPRSAFVADFMGRSNLVRGTLTERREDMLVVDTGLGILLCNGDETMDLGDTVLVSIRPGTINVISADDDDKSFDGVVVRQANLGETIDYVVQIKDEQLRVRARATTSFLVNDKVGLNLDSAPVAVPDEPIEFIGSNTTNESAIA